MPFSLSVRELSRAAMLAAALLAAGCANKQQAWTPGLAAPATPGSPQDFQVNVGDRVFFETDSSALTPQAQATLDRQVQWLQPYPRYTFTVEGHADERGTREYNLALGARRATAARDFMIVARHRAPAACAPSPTARSARSPSATTSPAGRRTAAP